MSNDQSKNSPPPPPKPPEAPRVRMINEDLTKKKSS